MGIRPGIFNDVIGPIMRGPSSSHTAASWRAARICMDILNEPLKKAIIDFDKDGAWASNYREQGASLGIEGGLLGLEISDDRMKNTELVAKELGISIQYQINSFKRSVQILAARHDAAVCELDGPRIIGPMTSLKIPGFSPIIYAILNTISFSCIQMARTKSNSNLKSCVLLLLLFF